jgi:hypothetical protein
MANASFGDAARDHLRTIVAAVEQGITRLPGGDGNHTTDELRASWTALVKQLALGPAPEMRECPKCHGIGMRAASRCGNCWTKLEPLEPATTDAAPATIDAAPATTGAAPATTDAARTSV